MRISDWSSDVCSSDLHGAGRPLLAAVVVSARRGGVPAPGFFRLAAELGLYFGPESGPQAALFPAMELQRVRATTSRSAERRVGQECVSTFSSRGSPEHEKTNTRSSCH